MSKLKVIETFAGIGAQTKALKNLGIEHEVVAISEWDINALISYAYIHKSKEMQTFVLPSKEEIIAELSKFTFSNDGKNPISKVKSIRDPKLYELYKAHKVTNNLSSILNVTSQQIPDFDLLTYSFPCQAISLQGKQEGLKKDTGTSSSLLWEIERILKRLKEEGRLPTYLLMENVANLFSKKFMPFFNEWVEFLNALGYETTHGILKASDFDCPQNRERAFAVSILKTANQSFTFPKGSLTQKTIADILEPQYVSQNLKLTHLESKLKHKKSADIHFKKTGLHSTILENYTTFQSENIAYFDDGISPTITANGAQSRIKIIDSKTGSLRYMSGCEHLKLMGFTKSDYQNLSNCSYPITDALIKKQAGNSICVPVLEAIFKNFFL